MDWVGTHSEREAQVALGSYFDLAIVDLFLANGSSEGILSKAKSESPNTRTIVLTRSTNYAAGDLDDALPAILKFPSSVDGFLIKGTEQDSLRNVITKEAQRRVDVLEGVEGVEQMVSDVVKRGRRRSSVPEGVTDRALAAEARAVISGLFQPWLDPDAWRSELAPLVRRFGLTPIDEGKSTCVVYQAEPTIAVSGRIGPAVMAVKIGPQSEIREELERYHRYVEVGIPLAQRTDLVRSWLGRNLGGILFSFLGDPSNLAIETPVTLGQGEIEDKIVSLFSPEGIRWYSVSGLEPVQLLQYYDAFNFGPGAAVTAIDELVKSVDKVNADHGTAEVLERPARRWLGKAVLGRAWPTTLVHGDLHLGNVVSLGTEGRFALIDYRNVGPGPRTLDFAAAEIALLLRSEPGQHPQGELVAELIQWYSTLQLDGESETPPEWLATAGRHLKTLRKFLGQTFDTEPVTPEELLACLFIVGLRRSRFRGLATSRSGERRDRVVLCGVIVTCAKRLGIL